MSSKEGHEVKPPDITILKDLEIFFYSKFENFLQSDPGSRLIVQVEIVGFQPFLKSTGNFNTFMSRSDKTLYEDC